MAANWDNCEGPWEYITAFGVGAGAGALTAATGGAGASVWAVAGVSALGSAATAATNSVIAQTQNNFTEGTVNWDQVGNSAVYGAIAGFASGAAGYAVGTGLNVRLYDANIKSPLLQSMIVSPLAAGAGHIAAGTAIGVYNGKSFDHAVFDSFDGIGQSMAIGGAIGVASTISVCFWKGVNPIRGNMLWPKNNGFKNTPKQTILEVETIIDRYGSPNGTYAAPQGTPLDARSLPPNTASEQTLYTYKVVKPLPALEGTTSRSFWFNTRGGGTQYKFDFSIQQLINEGYLIPIYYKFIMNIKETYKYIRKNDLKGKKHNKSYYHIAIDIIRFRIRGIAYGDWEYGDILEYKNKKWIVYYKERDTISMYKEFDNEKQACEEYLKRLKDLKYIQ